MRTRIFMIVSGLLIGAAVAWAQWQYPTSNVDTTPGAPVPPMDPGYKMDGGRGFVADPNNPGSWVYKEW